MSEVQSRPAPSRGRGSGRGGRGGYSSRSGARPTNRLSTTNGDAKQDAVPTKSSIEDEGEVGQMKKKHGSKVALIQEMFADWSEVDILFALQETDGDENLTVTRMAEGTISKWGEVSKTKKDRTKSKAKGDVSTTTTGESGPAHVRNGRGGRGGEGGRGRTTERGGGRGGRGRSAHGTNGTRKENVPLSTPTEEASGWDNIQPAEETTTGGWGDDANGWDTTATADPVTVDTSTSWDQPAPSFTSPPANTATQKTSIIPEGTQKTWASMLRQSTAPKPAPKPKEVVAAPEPIEAPTEYLPLAESVPAAAEHEFASASPGETLADYTTIEPEIAAVSQSDVALPPPTDQLTESNVEQVGGGEIMGPATETLKSETASSYDPRAPLASVTASPISASQQHHQMPRVPSSGYAATALKATERGAARTSSYQRRILDQEEAVRLPRGREQVERAALQFGAMGLDDEDVDGDREEAETRAQPPDDSPTAHPRTSLPPAQPNPVLDSYSAQKAASAIPTGPASATAPINAPTHPAASVASQAPAQAPTQPSQYASRFSHAAPQEQPTFPTPKPFDSFGQTGAPAAQSPYDSGFPHSQHMSQAQSMPQPQQPQQPQQQPSNVFSTAPGDYSNYYTADAQSRSAYNSNNNYYAQGFNQQAGSQAQDNASQAQHQQRAYNSYGAPQTENLSQYPQSVAHHAQSRYGNTAGADAQNSGNNTPNPTGPQAQQQTGQNSQGQSHGQQQSHDYASYGGSHPYFTSPYYTQYMGAYPGNYNQGGYGGPYGKNHMGYGGQAGYGMQQQGPQGYGSSPAGAFDSSLRAESGSAATGLSGNYGRGASGGQQSLGSSAFGGVPDAFARSVSGYQSQASQPFSAAGSQPSNGPVADDLKPYGEAKGAGPSPSLAAAARPGSAANNGPSQSGLPPPQGAQAGLGGYPGYGSHLQGHGGHGNQSGAGSYGMGGSGNQGGHQQNSYGGYGQGFGGGGNYYGNQQQARGGWGSNYH